MDLNQFFEQEGLRNITAAWRDQHLEDDSQYGQIAEVVQRRLAQQTIDGDGRFTAGRRARKVAKHLRKMQKASRKAAAAAEGLYGCFVNEVVELPARRQAELERKEARKQRLGIASGVQDAVAKSLTKTAATLAGQGGNPQVTATAPTVTYTNPTPYNYGVHQGTAQPVPDITNLFPDMSETG